MVGPRQPDGRSSVQVLVENMSSMLAWISVVPSYSRSVERKKAETMFLPFRAVLARKVIRRLPSASRHTSWQLDTTLSVKATSSPIDTHTPLTTVVTVLPWTLTRRTYLGLSHS